MALNINEKIKNTFIKNSYSTSTTDGYSANYVNGLVEVEEFTSQVTFNETVAGNTHFYKYGKLVVVMLQGETKTHSTYDLIATIPEGYRPRANCFPLFIKNNNAYGILNVGSIGTITVNQISSTTNSGRIYANFSYFIS